MIFTERTITIRNDSSTINAPVILYRGDKNVEVRFTLVESPYKYSNRDSINIIESTDASYAQLVIKTPNDREPIFGDITAVGQSNVIFVIDYNMIDEIEEVGAYDFQIRLFDADQTSMATIPEVVGGFIIKEPIAKEDTTNNITNSAIVGSAVVTNDVEIPTFAGGSYNKTAWHDGVVISRQKLDKIENGIYESYELSKNNSSQIKEKANESEVRKKNVLIEVSDLSQSVKESMTGGSVAVVGKGMVNYENLASDLSNLLGNLETLDVNMENGFRDTSNGTLQAHESFRSFILSCSEGQTFYITTKVTTGSVAICNYYSSGRLVSHVGKGQIGEYTDYEVTVPSGVDQISVTSTSTFTPSIKRYKIINKTIRDIDGTIKNIKEELKNNLYTEIYQQLDLEIQNGFYDTTMDNSSFRPHDSFYTIKTSCSEGEQYKATMYVSTSTLAKVVFFDSSDKKISYIDGGITGTFTDYEFTVPAGASYLSVTSRNSVTPTLSKKMTVNKIDYVIEDKVDKQEIETINNELTSFNNELKFEIDNMYNRILRNEKANEFEFKPADKSYFCFVIDDCNSFLPLALETFKNNGVPLSSATIDDRMNFTYNSVKVKDILNDLVNNGGEVLAHYIGSLTNDNTDEEWLNITRKVKKNLENEGFDVRGVIRADSTVRNSVKGEKYCRLYFDYSDGLGKSVQYNLQRKFFVGVRTLDDMKAYIDTCCETNGLYPFCFHGNRNDEPLATQENLELIINYIKSKGDNIEFTTYRDYYDKFKSTSLENRIINLESK